MVDYAKVTLTILGIPGSTKHFVGKKKVQHVVDYFDKKTKTIKQKTWWSKEPVYEYVPCSQRMNLTKDFFEYATSDQAPTWFTHERKDLFKEWRKMSEEKRLETHLMCIARSFGGNDFVYNILED